MHFASGNSLFSGTALVIMALLSDRAFLPPRYQSLGRSFRRILLACGILLIALSATPWPWWVYAAWLALLVVVLRHQRAASEATAPARGFPAVAFIVASLGLCAWEGTTLGSPSNVQTIYPRLYVLGDSISAGTGTEKSLWPDILGRTWQVDIVNLAKPGATTRSALEQAGEISTEAPALILIEIGGNDLLSERSAEDFQSDLRALLAKISTPARRVLLMELPLPPWNIAYGCVQRQVASEYGAGLISKRDFAAVLSRSGATIDHLHLSSDGHQWMAEVVAGHVVPRLERSSQMPRQAIEEPAEQAQQKQDGSSRPVLLNEEN